VAACWARAPSVPAFAARGILSPGEASPRNVDTDDPLRGRFARAGTAVASRPMTAHLIVLGILLALAAAVVLVLRRR